MTGPGKELTPYRPQLPGEVAGADIDVSAGAESVIDASTSWEALQGGDAFRLYHSAFLGNLAHLGDGRHGYRDSLEEAAPGARFNVVVSQASYGSTSVYVRPQEGVLVQAMVCDGPTGDVSWRDGYDDDDRVLVSSDRGRFGSGELDESPLREVLAESASAGTDIVSSMGSDSAAREQWGNPGLRTGLVRTVDETTGHIQYYALGVGFKGDADNWLVTGGVVEVRPKVVEQPQILHGIGAYATKPVIAQAD